MKYDIYNIVSDVNGGIWCDEDGGSLFVSREEAAKVHARHGLPDSCRIVPVDVIPEVLQTRGFYQDPE